MTERTDNHQSSSSTFRRLLATPLHRLIRGTISDHVSYQQVIDEADFDPVLAKALRLRIRKAGRRSCTRVELAKSLVPICQEQQKGGRSAGELAAALQNADPGPRGVAWKTHLQTLLESRLPTNAFHVLAQLTRRIRSRPLCRVAYDSCVAEWSKQMADGTEFAEIQAAMPDTIQLGNRINQLHCIEPVLMDDLPNEVSTILHDAVRRTRLWRNEKRDVAKELSTHFSAGLEAGASARELVESFGDTTTAAKLIRRAKVRCRPTVWWAWQRTWQLATIGGGLILMLWLVLFLRLVTASPNVIVDYVARFDDRQSAIPSDDRAWPIYREGLVGLTKDWVRTDFVDASEFGRQSKHWDTAKDYLERNDASVELFVQASRQPELGFLFDDPSNDAWLIKDVPEGVERSKLYDPKNSVLMVLLPHAQDLRRVEIILQAAIKEAAARGDAERVTELVEATFRLSSHARQTYDCAVSYLVSQAIYNSAGDEIVRLLTSDPGLMSDSQLERLTTSIKRHSRDFVIEGLVFDKVLIEDTLQRIYSDDGNGGGRVTQDGLRLLCSSDFYRPDDAAVNLRGSLPPFSLEDELTFSQNAQFAVFAPRAASLIADRKTLKAKMIELHDLYVDDIRRPYSFGSKSKFVATYDEIVNDVAVRAKLLPAVMFYQNYYHSWLAVTRIRIGRAASQTSQASWLAVIAIERYKRQEGEWPQSIEALVPNLLVEVPIDHFDGKSLRYRINPDGSPFVWSVGPDGVDIAAEKLIGRDDVYGNTDPTSGIPPGDWQLFPAVLTPPKQELAD
ncbi:MAG: hypothetical protein H8E66_31965 [Planctomycetes bacterium]|nr:hypothetical protein [Planctomycetota bacterium]